MPINNTLDVVIQEDDLIVLGPPSSVDISLDIGSQGNPGSQIYAGNFDPNSITAEQFSALYNVSPKTKDIFIRNDIGEYYGVFYSYENIPGGIQWESVLEIYDLVDLFFTNNPLGSSIINVVTASVDTNTTQIATTAFVIGQASNTLPLVNGTASIGSSFRYSRQDHVHNTDTTRAPSASPTFTGTVTVPTLSLTTADTTATASHYMVETTSDGVVRPKTLADTRTEIVTDTAMQSNIISPTAAGSNGIRKITISTSEPTGGVDGDVWLVYV